MQLERNTIAMTIKEKLLIALGIFIIFPAFAQKTYTVRGTIIDSLTQEPLSYVTVRFKNNASIEKSVLTEKDGNFHIEKLGVGKYVLKLIAVGYRHKYISINASDSAKYLANLNDSIPKIVDLGKMRLTPAVNQLKEVRISMQKPIIKEDADKISYDVQADPASKGENMLDIMRKVPMVSLDAEDNIELKGNSNYKIFINGRPSNMMSNNPREVLRSMPALSILRVEVITSPSAKYDSEGLAGIINIVTNRKINDGFKGYLGSYYNSRFSKGFWGGSTLKINKLAANININRYFNHNLGSISNSYRIGNYPTQTRTYQNGIQDRIYNAGGMKFGNVELSYEIDTLNLLTGSFAPNSLEQRQSPNQFFEIYDQFNNLNQSSLNRNESFKNNSNEMSLNYQLGFKNDKAKILTASYTFNKNLNDKRNQNLTNVNNTNEDLRQQNAYGSKEHTAQLDYIQNIKKIGFEGGLKLIERDFNSDFLSESYNPFDGSLKAGTNTANQFDYTQTIYALYNSYAYKLNGWGLKGGFRMERTSVNANFITLNTKLSRNYSNFIPSVNAHLKLSNSRSINFGYTQRIQRPGIGQLNPFEYQLSPLYYTSGNPDLLPVLNHNFEASFRQFKKGAFVASLDYSFANNAIQTVVTLGNDNINRSSFKNVGKNDKLGLNINLNYPATKKLNINFNTRVSHIWLIGTFNDKIYDNQGFQGNISSVLSYSIKKDLRVGTRFRANLPSITLQGRTNSFYASSFSANKDFFKKKVSVMVDVHNPFQKYNHIINKISTADFIDYTNTRNHFRSFYVNFIYNFGNLKGNIKKNKRGVKNDDIDKEERE